MVERGTGGAIGGLDDVLAADAEGRARARERIVGMTRSAAVEGRSRMSLIWYVLWFVVAVGLLVTVHEFGHFWVARRLGFKVLRFSVGFGRPLLKRVAGADRIEYVLAAVPLGGYVKLLDEREGPVAPADLPRSFTRRPPWQRIAGAAGRARLQHPVRHPGAVGHAVGQRRHRGHAASSARSTPGSVAARAGLRSRR